MIGAFMGACCNRYAVPESARLLDLVMGPSSAHRSFVNLVKHEADGRHDQSKGSSLHPKHVAGNKSCSSWGKIYTSRRPADSRPTSTYIHADRNCTSRMMLASFHEKVSKRASVLLKPPHACIVKANRWA